MLTFFFFITFLNSEFEEADELCAANEALETGAADDSEELEEVVEDLIPELLSFRRINSVANWETYLTFFFYFKKSFFF